MKFLKALVVCFLLTLPFIYGFNLYKSHTWVLQSGITRLGQLSSEISESSGLALADEPQTYFTHNDHATLGAPATLFKVDETGKLLKTYHVAGATNRDWEDLARDTNGNLYIADTGNNKGKRKTFNIYKVKADNPTQAEKISFTYGEQNSGNPDSNGKNHNSRRDGFDCEAIFWSHGNLYLVTKNRGKNSTAHLYKLPDTPGTYTATLITEKSFPNKITGAALSPDGRKLALLSLGSLYVFDVKNSNFIEGDFRTINLGNVGQTEGVVFKDQNMLVFTNEGGEIYQISL